MSANLPETVEIDPDAPAKWTVIWLHGLGADGHDFEPIVPELALPADTGVRFVFPHAPRRAVTLNGGLTMRAWYDLKSLDPADGEDVDGILDSASILRTLVTRETERGIAAERIVVAGFSQGGAIALHAGLRHEQPLAGIMGLSTYLPLGDRLPAEITEANRETPILMAHGRQDPVIPIDGARRSWRRIADMRPAPAWHEYDMPHAVCPAEIADIRGWLLNLLAEPH
ncbi:MAG: alpha/beta hydrolase fold domain-containing protein [Halofilum sp. (in: g-proteobacteria)]|nr:alpha/beta hydrolase fold domain-containing protein [Halofilum sp. (in: g-proteobacteria)]